MLTKYNFLFIFPDQWRGDCLSYLDHPVVETPFLDQLAKNGVTFTSAYSPCPTCIATRACVVTGMTPNSTGRIGYQDGVPWQYEHILMEELRKGGYETLCAGKTHFYPQRVKLGFEEVNTYDTQNLEGDYKSDYAKWLEKETNGSIRDIAQEISTNSWLAHPWEHPEYLHPNTWTAEVAIEMLENRDPMRPFFMQVGFHRPHPPYDPPISYYEKYLRKEIPPVPVGDWADDFDNYPDKVDAFKGHLPQHLLEDTRRAYYAQITHLDYQIGRIIHFLRKKRWLDSTYIIFTSDHGEALGDHHLFCKARPFECSAKVPFIVVPPKNVKCNRGTKCNVPITHMDIMPTLLEEAGLDIPGTVEGLSIATWVRGQQTKWRDYVHGEHPFTEEGWQYVTDGREKYAWETLSGKEFFFDLTIDPNEMRNLINDENYAARVTLWRMRLIDILSQRPQDGLTDGERLIAGKILEPVRKELLEQVECPDGRIRPIR